MIRYTFRLPSVMFLLFLVFSVLLASSHAQAQCTPVASGLANPLGITQSNQGNLIVSETGTTDLHSGRLSIVDINGVRRTLLSGLPSAINDVGEPSGPAGVFLRGRTLYLAIGIGDSIVAGGPGVAFANPNPSSPIFSSVLAIHFSASVEKNTSGFSLTVADQLTLASGEELTLSNGSGDEITIELVANFPNFTPNPVPPVPGNVRGANPFDLVIVGDQIYVSDGGQNAVWQVDSETGGFFKLVTFPPIPNPLPFGPPVVEAVPTGIAYSDGQLLVTLFRGFPFPAGSSVVKQVDPLSGAHTDYISGLSSAIDVLAIENKGDTDHLVLQFSTNMLADAPGSLLRFETPASAPTVVAGCLITPTSMTLDAKNGTLYITELGPGRVVSVPIAP